MQQHLLTVTLALCCSFFQPLFGQERLSCGTDQQMQALYAQHPELKAEQQQFLSRNFHTVEKDGETRAIYTIPVVFHILHQYGYENIADAQVYDQLATLNEDFRRMNDLSFVIPEFTGLEADCEIEFRLATLDPQGNCTNGIEHVYTYESYLSDDYSKLNQWPRDRYLNIWVTPTLAYQGVAGYAYFPAAVNGTMAYADGILILHDYIGSIGTGHAMLRHTLTHEIAHYLGLQHPWGEGPVNTVCGDDGIADTPVTKGHDNCSNPDDSFCTPGVVENVQNFMESSYCPLMFTEGQATFLRATLESAVAQRNNLVTAANHTATGIDVLTPPTCVPVADFSVKDRICVGQNVQFKDASWRAGVTTHQWYFPGGTPATSTDPSPLVTYDTPGVYSAKLVVTNAAGTDSMELQQAVHVAPVGATYMGPQNENFEGASAGEWQVSNPGNSDSTFVLVPVGNNSAHSYGIRMFRDVSGAAPYSEDWFYNDRLGKQKDYLISPSFNLLYTSNITVSFDYAYTTRTTLEDDNTGILRVYASRDCGATWILRQTIEGMELVTSAAVDSPFIPTSASQWQTATFNYTNNAYDTRTLFRFEFMSSDHSNNFYLDNINVNGTLGIADETNAASLISMAPNPVAANGTLSVSVATSSELALCLTDMNGSVISTTPVHPAPGTQTVALPMNVAKGCYLLHAVSGTSRTTSKVVVF